MFAILTDESAEWSCYVCDPTPLEFLVKNCDETIDFVNKELLKKAKSSTNISKHIKNTCGSTREFDIDYFDTLTPSNIEQVLELLIPATETINLVLPSMKESLDSAQSEKSKLDIITKIKNVMKVYMKSLSNMKNLLNDNSKQTSNRKKTNGCVLKEESDSFTENGLDLSEIDEKSMNISRSKEDIEAQRMLHRELLLDSSSDENSNKSSNDDDESSMSSSDDDVASNYSDYNPKEDIKDVRQQRKDRKRNAETQKKKKIRRKKCKFYNLTLGKGLCN